VLPDYAWIGYLLGRIYFEQGDYDRALLFIQEGIDLGLKAPELLKKYVLPVREKGNPCDGRRIIDYMWQSVYEHDNEFQVKSFFHLSYELVGDIYRLGGKQDEAMDAYFEAINYLKIPHCIYKLNQLLIQSKKYEKMPEIAKDGIEDSPFDSIMVLYNAYALLRSGKRLSAFEALREHQKALKSFIGNRQVRVSLFIILPLVLLGKQPASTIIMRLINTLNKKVIIN
jgi:tetratricopeptide (TPR) repeat protein